jgi:DNA-binding transcriptional ArsR family regulator
LDTTQLIEQVPLPRMTALRNLKALEGAGYVVSSDPPGTRRGGRRALWTLDPERLRETLAAVLEYTTPPSKEDR